MRTAIERGGLEVHYQPIHNITTGHVEALEALVRWRHPAHGLMDPSHFVHIAEESGLIYALGERVLDAACADLRTWQTQGFPDLRMAVNLSAREFDRTDIVDCIVDTLKRHAVAAEHRARDHGERAHRGSRRRGRPSRAAASLGGTHCHRRLRYPLLVARLPAVPADQRDQDRPDVCPRSRRAQDSSASIVSAMSGIARGFGLSLVAEGVEKPEHVEALRAFGCDMMQGYHFSPPLPAPRVGEYLARFNPPTADPAATSGAPDA